MIATHLQMTIGGNKHTNLSHLMSFNMTKVIWNFILFFTYLISFMGNFFFSISKLNYMQPIFLNFEINQVNNPKTFKPLCTRICNYHKHQTSNLIKKYVTKNNTTKNEKKKQLKKNIS